MIFLLIGLISFSCNNGKLTNRKAKNIVKEFYEFPNVEIREFSQEKILSKPDDTYTYLVNQGIINKPEYQGSLFKRWIIRLAPEGQRYVNSSNNGYLEVATNIKEFRKIESIHEIPEYNAAEVKFSTIRKKIIPFGAFYEYKEGDIEIHTLGLIKYNDGWKVERDKPKILLETDFDCFNGYFKSSSSQTSEYNEPQTNTKQGSSLQKKNTLKNLIKTKRIMPSLIN